MSKIGSAHCNPKIKPALNHNDRTNARAKTIDKDLSYKNEVSCSSKEVKKQIEILYKEAYENFFKYCEKKHKGVTKSGKPKGIQNFTKKERCYHEFIYEINENTTMQECQELTNKIAELTKFTPLQIAIHRDEGHTNEKGEKVTHYHAHAVFFTLDRETGLQLARKEASLNPQTLSEIQTHTANILKMQRGENRYEYNKERPKDQQIKSPRYIQDYKEYARVKEQENKIKMELAKKEAELNQRAQEIETKENNLKAKYDELERQKNDLMNSHRKIFDDLDKQNRLKKKGLAALLKNLFSGGKYFKKLDNEKKEQEKALRAQINEVKREITILESRHQQEIKRKDDALLSMRKSLDKANQENTKLENSRQSTINKNKELNERLKSQDEKITSLLKAQPQNEKLKETFPDHADAEKLKVKERDQQKNLHRQM